MMPPRRKGPRPWPNRPHSNAHPHQHSNSHQRPHQQRSHQRQRYPGPNQLRRHPVSEVPRPGGAMWMAEDASKYTSFSIPWPRFPDKNISVDANFRMSSAEIPTISGWKPQHQVINKKKTHHSSSGHRLPLLPLPIPCSTSIHSDACSEGNSRIADPPYDKRLCDAIETVKRKLKEQKPSETRDTDSFETSSTESSSTKISDKKRTEHVKSSPKASMNIKKEDKKDEKNKTPNTSMSMKPEQCKKSQIMRRKILQQLFKLDNNNLRKFLSYPESSVKYNSAFNSLIKDTRNLLSKELRNVAEKSLKFHNISANTEQGEKIVQDAFLGHLGKMLDINASVELFNMDPQIINELSKVLQDDLMCPLNEEASVKNLANVMQESIMDELPDNFNSISDVNSNNIEGAPSNIINCRTLKQELLDNCHDNMSNEDIESKLSEQSCAANVSILDDSGLGNSAHCFNSDISANRCKSPSIIWIKTNDGLNRNATEEILRNFDIATNKYETTLNTERYKKSKRKRLDSFKDKEIKREPENNLIDVNEKDDNIDDVNFTENQLYPKLTANVKTNDTFVNNFLFPFNNMTNSSYDDCNMPCFNANVNLLPNINVFQNDIDVFQQSYNKSNSNDTNFEATISKISGSNTKDDKNEKSQCNTSKIVYKKKKLKTNNASESSLKSQSFDMITECINSNAGRSELVPDSVLIENIVNSDNNISTIGVEDAKSLEHKINSIRNNQISLVDISKLVNDDQIQINAKNCVKCSNKVHFKCQGTQYYDFGKIDSSTQVYASLIISKSKGVQARTSSQDISCQTLKNSDFSSNCVTSKVVHLLDNESQTVEIVNSHEKKSSNSMVNKEVQVSLNHVTDTKENSTITKQSDIIRRMKQIDSDIQLLIQEKFKLYKMMEACPSFNNSDEKPKPKFKSNFFSNVSENKPRIKTQSDKPISNSKNCNTTICEKSNLINCNTNKNLHKKTKKYHKNKQSNNIIKCNINKLKTNNDDNSNEACFKNTTNSSTPLKNLSKKNNKNGILKKIGEKVESSEKQISVNSQSIVCTNITDVTSVPYNCDKNSKTASNNNNNNNKQNSQSLVNNCFEEALVNNSQLGSYVESLITCIDSNKDVNYTRKLQNKIVCKRKEKTIAKPKSKKTSNSTVKRTPLSALMDQLDESGDDIDVDFVNIKPTVNNNSDTITNVNVTVEKEVEIVDLKKKYNLKNCSVNIQPVNVDSNLFNIHKIPDIGQQHKNTQNCNDYSLCLDDINNVEFENLTDPDIPSMLENIRASETMTLIENWDSKLFDNITLSESVHVFENSLTDQKSIDLDNNLLDYGVEMKNDSEVFNSLDIKFDNDVNIKEASNTNNNVLLKDHSDSIIAIECTGNKILAASLDGNVYCYCIDQGILLKKLECSNLAITSLWIKDNIVYTGSLDSNIKCFDLNEGIQISKDVNVGSPIQSMCAAWNVIFIGTRTGFVVRFDIKTNSLVPDGALKFSDQAILALHAMKEGPRKVLLIASRSQDVTVKDANTGLLLRRFHGPNTTVYSLLLYHGKVFCGTSGSQIQVFDFVTEELVGFHSGGNGAVCLKLYKGLLFAGCYDGIIYVFKLGTEEPIARIQGPGKMLLAIAIINNKIIGGCNDKTLSIWNIPNDVISEMSDYK